MLITVRASMRTADVFPENVCCSHAMLGLKGLKSVNINKFLL